MQLPQRLIILIHIVEIYVKSKLMKDFIIKYCRILFSLFKIDKSAVSFNIRFIINLSPLFPFSLSLQITHPTFQWYTSLPCHSPSSVTLWLWHQYACSVLSRDWKLAADWCALVWVCVSVYRGEPCLFVK